MTTPRDKFGRPVVVVTGMGVVTSLGAGKADNWAKLTAGESGIRTVTRFPVDGLKTTMAGTVDFVTVEPFSSTGLTERLADIAAEEALEQAGIGSKGNFPGPLFLAVAPVEVEWPQRLEAGRAIGKSEFDYNDLLRISGGGKFAEFHHRFMFGSVASYLAETFGTKGSPISLSTACASGATAIQLGVEAIRRGEADAALCVATDGSVNPEALVRFSLLSALSTQHDPPQAASKPFSKNRDGFVMAEGAGALVLESYEAAVARGAPILGVVAGCGELTDSFHRTGAIYSLAPSSDVSNKPPGEWKTMLITLAGDRIVVSLDGKRITSFDPDSPDVPPQKQWYEPKREPKRPAAGYIGLQNHDPGDIVWFKEVSVRPLPAGAAK